MSTTNIRSFVDRLLVTGDWVPPAVVLVEDYRDRAETAAALRDEADIHGVNLQEFSNLETLESRLPEFSAARKDGALLLVNTDEGARWGVWLEANREKLLEWFALTLILIMPDEWPRLVRVAPSFYSWTKGQIVQACELTQPSIGVEELEAAMEDMRQATIASQQSNVLRGSGRSEPCQRARKKSRSSQILVNSVVAAASRSFTS